MNSRFTIHDSPACARTIMLQRARQLTAGLLAFSFLLVPLFTGCASVGDAVQIQALSQQALFRPLSMDEIKSFSTKELGITADRLANVMKTSKLKPRISAATYNIVRFGQVLYERKEYSAARLCFEKAVQYGELSGEDRPVAISFLLASGIELLRQKEYAKALQVYDFINEHKLQDEIDKRNYKSFVFSLAVHYLSNEDERGGAIAESVLMMFSGTDEARKIAEILALKLLQSAVDSEKLKELINKFPGTEAAEEAKEKLESIEGMALDAASREIEKLKKERPLSRILDRAFESAEDGLDEAEKAIDSLFNK